MEISTLQSISPTLILKSPIPHYKAKITCDNNGRVQGYLKRGGEHCYQPIAVKGLPDYLTKGAIGKTAKMLTSSYVKLQGNHLNVMPKGLGGIPPEEDAPKCFFCPISHEIMETPIVSSCGHTFEKRQLLQWIDRGDHTCPICQKDLNLNSNPDNWSMNHAIKNQIDEWQQKRMEPVCPRILSENPASLDTAKSNLFLQLAKYYLEQKNYSEAIKQCEEAIKDADNIETYAEYVQLLLIVNYPLKASKAFVYLARWHKREKNPQEVVKAYQKAIQLQPENKDFLEEFAKHLEEMEEKEEAVHCYETLIEISKKEEESFLALAKYYKKLIELEPNELKHYGAYRTLLKANGKREEVEKIKEKIFKIQGITWSDPEKAILKKKIEKLKGQHAMLEEEVIQLKASEQRLETAMQAFETRIVATLNAGLKEQKWNEEKQVRINSFINAIPGEIGRKAVQNAVEILRKNDPTVTELKLESNKIGTAGARALAEALEGNQTITQLYIQGNQIGDEGIQAIARTIENNPQIPLQQLSIESNRISDEGAGTLARVIEYNPQIALQQLALINSQISIWGAVAIAKAIENNRQIPLQQLKLGGNQIGERGAIAIASVIENNVQIPLQTLALSSNQIGDNGALVLARAIEHNPQIPLQQLDLRNNQISNEGALTLTQALKNNLQLPLQHLDLRGNPITPTTLAQIQALLQHKRNQQPH